MGPRYGRQLAKIGVVIEHQLVPKSEAVLTPIVRCVSDPVFRFCFLARHARPPIAPQAASAQSRAGPLRAVARRQGSGAGGVRAL